MSSCITKTILHGMFNDLYVRSMHIDLCKCLLLVMDIAVKFVFVGSESFQDENQINGWWEEPHRHSENPQAETLPEQGSGNWVGQALSAHFELWSIRSSVLNKIGQIKSVISEKPVWADKDSMDFLFPIMSWIPYIYCYPLPWGCPCCFPPRKQHLDSCRWMMSKQAPWSWFSRCSMIASHHFLTIFSGCTGGKVFPILWKNQRCLAG